MNQNKSDIFDTLTINDTQEGRFQCKPNKIKNFILRKYRNKYFIKTDCVYLFFIFLIIGFLLSISTANEINFHEIKFNTTDLILSSSRTLSTFNLETKKYSCCDLSWNGIFEPYDKSKFFWVQRGGAKIFINSSQKTSNNNDQERSYDSDNHIRLLMDNSKVTVQDIAYDNVGDKLYVIDNSTDALIAIAVTTGYSTILSTNFLGPFYIEVDTHSRLIFILQSLRGDFYSDSSIVKCNMDGSSIQIIIREENLVAMAIDYKNQRIYWIDKDEASIKSSDYEGKNRRYYPINVTNIVDLAVINNELFWLWEQDIDELVTHYLSSYTIKNNFWINNLMVQIQAVGESTTITAMQSAFNDTTNTMCKMNNVDCEHLCFLKSNGEHSCACKLGWQLNIDNKTCRKVKNFILYANNYYFRGVIMDFERNNSVDVFWPSRYQKEFREMFLKQNIQLAYDSMDDNLYFTDTQNIYTMKLISNSIEQKILIKGEVNINIDNLAYDWFTGNLYYIENKLDFSYKIKVFNVKLGSDYVKTLIDHIPGKYDKNIWQSPSSLAFHPTLGHLFCFNYEDQFTGIKKFTANGTEILKSNKKDQSYFAKIPVLDYMDQKIYWAYRNQDDRGIKYTDFNGLEIKTKYLDLKNYVISMDISSEWIYITEYQNIWRINKVNGTNLKKVAYVNNAIMQMRIVEDSSIKYENGQFHPCSSGTNGGCEQFCFMYESNAVCDCRDGEILDSEGHCLNNSVDSS